MTSFFVNSVLAMFFLCRFGLVSWFSGFLPTPTRVYLYFLLEKHMILLLIHEPRLEHGVQKKPNTIYKVQSQYETYLQLHITPIENHSF